MTSDCSCDGVGLIKAEPPLDQVVSDHSSQEQAASPIWIQDI